MLEKNIREQIIDLMHRQVVPAVGCTEPMAVALCTARATELLGQKPEKISAFLSANILKNAMGVGIPGTGMIGLPIAISLGALIGKSEYQLEVIKDLTPETLEEGKQYVSENRIDIKLKEGITEKLYIEMTCEAGGKKATAIISKTHTNFVYEEVDGKVLLDKQVPAEEGAPTDNKDIKYATKILEQDHYGGATYTLSSYILMALCCDNYKHYDIKLSIYRERDAREAYNAGIDIYYSVMKQKKC